MDIKRKQLLHQIPNALSALRILCTLGLIFVEPMKQGFFLLYTVCGLTDVLDGFLARRMRCTSDLGAVLDSIADLSFYAMMILRLFPILWRLLDTWVWILGIGTVLIRVTAYGIAAWKYHRFAALHTYMNKVTGFAVFVIPYLIVPLGANTICTVACVIGALGSLEECILHLTAKKYDESRKSILMKTAQ